MKRTKQFFFAITGQYNAQNTCSKAKFEVIKLLLCSDTGGLIFDKETYLHIDGPIYRACSAVQVLYFFEYKPPSKCQSVTLIKVIRVISRSEPLFQSVRIRLRFASTQIIRFSPSSLFAILKNTVQVRLRFDKNSVKPVYKTPVRLPGFRIWKNLYYQYS